MSEPESTHPNSIQIRAQHQIHPTERALVEWVATAAPGAELPEPWAYAMNPTESMLRTLVNVGVIGRPSAGADLEAIARDAGPAAREWLEQHPAEPPPA